jgi:hypothetical protein
VTPKMFCHDSLTRRRFGVLGARYIPALASLLVFMACSDSTNPSPSLTNRIVFVSNRLGYQDVYAMAEDGSGQRNLSHPMSGCAIASRLLPLTARG